MQRQTKQPIYAYTDLKGNENLLNECPETILQLANVFAQKESGKQRLHFHKLKAYENLYSMDLLDPGPNGKVDSYNNRLIVARVTDKNGKKAWLVVCKILNHNYSILDRKYIKSLLSKLQKEELNDPINAESFVEFDESELETNEAVAAPVTLDDISIEKTFPFNHSPCIYLSDDQLAITEKVSSQLVINGKPGSGKTLLALRLMLQQAKVEKKVLYVSPYSYLVEEMKQKWAATPGTSNVTGSVEFITTQDLIKRELNLSDAECAEHFVTANYAHTWLNIMGKSIWPEYAPDKAQRVYQEFQIISGFNEDQKQLYVKDMGKRQSLFAEKDRDKLFTLYKKYQDYLASKNKIDPRFYTLKSQCIYDYVVVDEMQGESIQSLANAINLSKNKEFCLLGNNDQDIIGGPDKSAAIVQWGYRQGMKIELKDLLKSYRFSSEIQKIANMLLETIKKIDPDKPALNPIDCALKKSRSIVEFYENEADIQKAIAYFKTNKYAQSIDVMMLGNSNNVLGIKKQFANAEIVVGQPTKIHEPRFVYSTQQCGGLEAQVVYLVDVIDESYKGVNDVLAEKREATGEDIAKLRELLIAITRVVSAQGGKLVVIQRKNHAVQHVMDLIKNTIKKINASAATQMEDIEVILSNETELLKREAMDKERMAAIGQGVAPAAAATNNSASTAAPTPLMTEARTTTASSAAKVPPASQRVTTSLAAKKTAANIIAPPKKSPAQRIQQITPSLSPLYEAARDGKHKKVKTLLASRIDINAPNGPTAATALYIAALNGHLEVVKLLLKQPSIEINKAQQNGFTPLIVAAQSNHIEVLKLLLARKNIMINSVTDKKNSALYMAAQNGHSAVVKLLLDQPEIIINQPDINEVTPLGVASHKGHLEVVKLLLNRDETDINKANRFGATPLYESCDENHMAITSLLLKNPKINVNQANNDNWTPLHIGTQKNNIGTVKLLLEHSEIDVNITTENGGSTALYIAAQLGHDQIAKLLLAQPKIDVERPNIAFFSPLMTAVIGKNTNIIKEFVEANQIDLEKTITTTTASTLIKHAASHSLSVQQNINRFISCEPNKDIIPITPQKLAELLEYSEMVAFFAKVKPRKPLDATLSISGLMTLYSKVQKTQTTSNELDTQLKRSKKTL